MKRSMLALALLVAMPVSAQVAPPLQQRVETVLAEAGPGVRYGLVVTDEAGREIVAINPDGRFIPASNTKMFTTAVAFHTMTGLDQPDVTGGTVVRLDGKDVILEGAGDARLSSAADCKVDCLAVLADAVAARTKRIRDVIGDDTLFPDQRWSQGMSWNNIPSRSGTGISALTLDDNELALTITPGADGAEPKVEGYPYFTIDNRIMTVTEGKTDIGYDRDPNGMTLRLTGTIKAGAAPEVVRVGIDDPAHYAAWRFRTLLEARGVRVKGKVTVRRRATAPADDPANRGNPPVRAQRVTGLAQLTPPPLGEDLTHINKVSQNLHAELLLRRVGLVRGTGSTQDGLAAVRAMLTLAGVPRTAYDFSDGSGMSTYNRVAPRGMTTFLRWIAAQPWGEAYRATLPIGGVDGTLNRRFRGTVLEGRIFAKTGTLNATNGLSGYMTAKSGKRLIFSAYANDVPEGVSATKWMDAVLVLIAEAN
ncbi:D-alanyl-D-alanine carboxypeptidase/D-alanyl-D-alanine-endopeptidase [Sphingomonas sp. AOB5]|uniref:D-alanyl-D-alanine carboxypeptidase/D-alanyl-D-alanine endopeptidase n=1 Tax=Sphingomonas sp. AOB5 TaxID=3034017 RepID=UPI0023F8AEA3|nr:D-alanyl-D-alanine carboxypeptidase/D-alanyl-D-alanine-endopeptidase [Sphingomonas sp. AOB5]MDF7773948.1 D-alanyl-D-alanine carboxypeptidase/D-alanyl-D-alanine-endopeptidase [Sphingomonas sp. AOB5]